MHCLNFLCQRLLESKSALPTKTFGNGIKILHIKEQTPCNRIQRPSSSLSHLNIFPSASYTPLHDLLQLPYVKGALQQQSQSP